MEKTNYGMAFDKTLNEIRNSGKRPKLLLHVCCAPCSSHVLEVVSEIFETTLFFYNPNIQPEQEFSFRLNELERFITEAGYSEVKILNPPYVPNEFLDAVKGLETLPEGGERCKVCYHLRLQKAAETASNGGYEWFTTTLSISPYKNAEWLNEIGISLGNKYGIPYLISDFKKKNGYQRSIELSKQYGLYRQNYCGCIYSKLEAEIRRNNNIENSKEN